MHNYTGIKYKGLTFPAWDVIGYDVNNNTHLFLEKSREEVKTIVVVGTCYGDEILSFLKYPNTLIYGFEPEPGNFKVVSRRYQSESRVCLLQAACSDSSGEATFYESHALGNGSLLKVKDDHFAGFKDSFKVTTIRLDEVSGLKGEALDLLWIDVQGAELLVLKGAETLLPRTGIIYVEISLDGTGGYEGRAAIGDLDAYLKKFGFERIAQGVNPTANDGNAIYSRIALPDDFFSDDSIMLRLQSVLHSERLKYMALNNWVYRLVGRLIPVWIKNYFKTWL